MLILLVTLLHSLLVAADVNAVAYPDSVIFSGGTFVTLTAPPPPPTVQPCCWIAGAFQGVRVNTWYHPVTQYTATVVTTFLRSNGTTKALNSSTISLPQSDIFSGYGVWGPGASHADGIDIPTTTIPGVGTTLIPDALMTDLSEYGVTQAEYGNVTARTLADYRASAPTTIFSPTAYATFYAAVYTSPLASTATSFDSALCGTPSPVPYVRYSDGAWSVVNKTELLPFNTTLSNVWSDAIVDDSWTIAFFSALPAPPPNFSDGITIELPSTASGQIAADPIVSTYYPWITNCFTLGGTGEPTVHVPVATLTTDSSVFIDAAVTSSPVALPQTTTTSDEQTGEVANTSTAEQLSRIATPTPEQQSPTSLTDSDTQSLPEETAKISPSALSSTSTTSIEVTTIPGTTIQPSTVAATTIKAITVAVGSSGGVTQYSTIQATIIPASTISGTTYAASTVTIAAATSILFSASAQPVTIGGKVYTASAAPSGAVVVDGTTIAAGSGAVVNGETVSIAGTNLIVASGSSKTTEGLGGAIISGIGGSGSSSSTPILYSNGANRNRGVRGSFFVVSSLFLAFVSAVAALPQHTPGALTANEAPSAAGFKNATFRLSRGGQAACVDGYISVQASTDQNVKFDFAIPANQSAVTDTFLKFSSSGSSFLNAINEGKQTPDAIQLATHGIGFDRTYWDYAPGYSYVDVAVAHGKAVFFYDRLAVGQSQKADPIQVVQAALEVEIAHRLVLLLRGGAISGHKFGPVCGVGHSFGSIITNGVTSRYPEAFAAVVLTGFSLNSSAIAGFTLGNNWAIARENAPTRFAGLDNAYLVSDTIIATQTGFFRLPEFSQTILAMADAGKQTVTFGEYFTQGAVGGPAPEFTGPVAVVNGDSDSRSVLGTVLIHPILLKQ